MDKTEAQRSVLVVEDEAKIAQLLCDYLHNNDYKSHWIEHGNDVVDWVQKNKPDLVLLDLMLPGKDGISICQEIRKFSDVPIIMITARVEEIDRILGLEIGANDYICKPFSPREMMARIKALFRTQSYHQQTGNKQSRIISLDSEKMQAVVSGQTLELTTVEFRLLNTLVQQPGRIFSRSQLMDKLYEDNRIVTDRTVDSHIKNLRKKIAVHYNKTELIKSIYGAGYKLDAI